MNDDKQPATKLDHVLFSTSAHVYYTGDPEMRHEAVHYCATLLDLLIFDVRHLTPKGKQLIKELPTALIEADQNQSVH